MYVHIAQRKTYYIYHLCIVWEGYFLYNKGYSKEIIIDVFESKNFDNSDNYEREYNKLYNKYKNKYNGKELDLFIKNKLYLKGFIK